jgi:hypothetical protein
MAVVFIREEYKGNFKNKISKMAQLEVYSFAKISLRLMVLCKSSVTLMRIQYC